MDAEIIAVGSELLTPSRVDTNSLFLTEQFNNLGVEVVAKAVIGDDRDRLSATVRAAVERSEIVVLTGGLGPTEDDVTRDAVAQALERPLTFRQDLCDAIEARFRRLGRRMAEINRRQAFVIEGAEALGNDNGTAPGLWIELSADPADGAAPARPEPNSPAAGSHAGRCAPSRGRAVILLPGPPRELKPMFAAECLPRLRRIVPPMVIRTLMFRVAGMAESDLDQAISPAYKKYQGLVTTVLAAPGDIQVHLRARCRTDEEAAKLLADAGAAIEDVLGERIYSRNENTLEAVVGQMLRERRARLTVAESCTGGLLAQRLTSIPGSSDYFVGGFVVYSAALKESLLGVPAQVIEEHTVVSEPVARAMAEGARQRTGAEYAIAITGEAGPESGSGQPVGTMLVAVATPDDVTVDRKRWFGDRERDRLLATQHALDLLRLHLLHTT